MQITKTYTDIWYLRRSGNNNSYKIEGIEDEIVVNYLAGLDNSNFLKMDYELTIPSPFDPDKFSIYSKLGK